MVNPNWNLLGSVDVGGAFNQGVEAGRQRRAEGAIDEQFRQMAQNPNAPVSNDLIRFAPQEAYKLQQQRAQAQQQQEQANLRVSAVRGDKSALEQLAGINLDDYRNLQGDQRAAAKAGIETIGQLALMADTAQEWDSIVGQLAQTDPSFRQYIGRFDMREAVIAQANQAKTYLEQTGPQLRNIGPGEGLYDVSPVRTGGVPRVIVQPNTGEGQFGQPAGPPQAGQVEDGYEFLGGDPANPKNWRQAGGASGDAGGNFQR